MEELNFLELNSTQKNRSPPQLTTTHVKAVFPKFLNVILFCSPPPHPPSGICLSVTAPRNKMQNERKTPVEAMKNVSLT